SNTGKTGLNWSERDNYGQSFANSIDVDDNTGNLSFNAPQNDDLDSWSGRFEGQGFPAVKTAGIHYNDKWDEERQTGNLNYKYMDLEVVGTNNTNSQFILPDTFYYNNSKSTFHNEIIRHNFNTAYEIKFDSTFSLKLLADGGTDHKITNSVFHTEALASDSSMVNENDRTVSTLGDVGTINSNLLLRKKLAKKGRTISLNIRENYSNNNSSGFLKSNTQYFTGGAPSSDSVIDQYKQYHTDNILLDTKLTYTEPLSPVSYLTAGYGVIVNNSHSNRNSFNKGSNGKYGSLDSLYSNDYQYNQLAQRGGLTYSLIKKKFRVNLGNDIGLIGYDQRDLHADTSVSRRFVNFYPAASVGYSFSNQQRLNFNYNGNTTQPTLAQIQPILTNEDPLNITIGNPGLKPQFTNRFGLFYNDYKVLSERGIWVGTNTSFTQNAIGNSVNVDATGKRVTQYVNVNGNYNVSLFGNYNRKFQKLNMYGGLYLNASQNKNVSYVNGLSNATRSGNYSAGFNIYKSKEKKYEFSFRPGATYTLSQSSINTGITTHYWTWSGSSELDVFLPLHFQIHGDADINLRQKTEVFQTNNNVVLINGWIGKKFLKGDALLLKAAVNDLLNQNAGFNRTVNSNFITQNTYTTIQRYFLFSIVWNFTKAGTPAPNNNGN
ncbi:MAG TPA: outer membrane beta-barrel protein, partial [Puia sp.]|nr:outer membrane beta-barrel protein [Puia sp.]